MGKRSVVRPIVWLFVLGTFVPLCAVAETSLSFSNPRFEPLDENGDGVATALVVHVDAHAGENQAYRVEARLVKGDKVVSFRESHRNTRPSQNSVQGAGARTLRFRFSGEEIYQSGEDGPYELRLSVRTDSTERVFSTPAYSHTAFGEVPARILSVSETPIDADGDGVFEDIRLRAKAHIIEPGRYGIVGALDGGDSRPGSISTAFRHGQLNAGVQDVELVLPGLPILRSGVDGPYKGRFALHNDKHDAQVFRFPTQSYKASQFAALYAYAGGFAEEAIDADGDGLFDLLRVSFAIDPLHEGAVNVSASLRAGSRGAGASTKLEHARKGSKVVLDFGGSSIASLDREGPYDLQVHFEQAASAGAQDRLRDSFALPRVAAASRAAFGRDNPQLLAYADSLMDADGNGLADQLLVNLKLRIKAAGTYEYSGVLTHFGRTRTDLGHYAGRERLEAGEQTLTLRFDARRMGAIGHNASFGITKLQVRAAEGPQRLSKDLLGATREYQVSQFEGYPGATSRAGQRD